MFHPRQLPILISQLTGLEVTLHNQKYLRRQSHQHGTGNCLPLILLNVRPVIQHVWTRPWGLFREKCSHMFQIQSLPSGKDEHASIAYGRAVLGREKMGSKLGQWWHLAGVGQQ